MMYLGIIMFAACSTFGLVQSEEERPFICPECFAMGENARNECDANIENKPCLEDDPVCTLVVEYIPEKERFRACISKYWYDIGEKMCQAFGSCSMTMCNTSGYIAAEPSGPLWCSHCSAEGDNAASKCDANIFHMQCREKDPVCILLVSTQTSSRPRQERKCSSREDYYKLIGACDATGYCMVAKCETIGCKAEIPT